ncbi:MAG TPA: nucleoside-diphosphate sugar epimerase/dehydratase [Cyclobacteriaceae bacterium]|nr:nucleoside-diphosphate sugar epimerase/dehydratase [Cyclobacteriaceae bacterium]
MIVFIDVSVIGFSALLGYLLRFNFSVPELQAHRFQYGIIVYASCGLLSILITNSHRGIIRYTGIQDGVRIFYMTIVNVALVSATNLAFSLSYRANAVPYSVILITLLSSFLLLFNYRLLVKYIFSYYRNFMIKQSRVMIFGAGQTGIITRHVLESTPRMKVVGFLEDAEDKTGKVIDGISIFDAKTSDLQRLFDDFSIDELIFTPKDISLERKNEVVDACMRSHVKVRTVPPVEKWVKGELSLNQIKEINIEELLGREAIKINNRSIETDLRGKKILITGAAGSIGSEIFRQVAATNPAAIILVDQAESALYELELESRSLETSARLYWYLADVNNKDRMRSIFEAHRPTVVYHAAAYKHVPMMENNPAEAITCNILGTKTVADLAVQFSVSKFVMVSTDKAVKPTNVMGCSKRIAEIYVQSYNDYLEKSGGPHTAFVTTRFGNVLGSNGSVIPLFKKQIQDGGPITVTHPEITRFFMTIPEACQLVLEAGTMGKGGEIFIFDMGKSIKILDLAEKMIWLSGLQPRRDVDIVFTGLREGEKLYEELLNDNENTTRTHHQKIMIAKVQHYSYEEVNRYVELFEDLIYDKNELKSVALMKELVPEFRSNYSRYEVLDDKSDYR